MDGGVSGLSRLAVLVRQLQGMLGGRATRGGSSSVTWPGAAQGSNVTTITHDLGKTPTDIQLTPVGSYAVYRAQSAGDTTFDVVATTHDLTSPAAGTQRFFYWTAFG